MFQISTILKGKC